jgi:hypothetical protein
MLARLCKFLDFRWFDIRQIPATACAFLVLVLATLAFRARQRNGYGPFLLGLVATIGVLVGKFRWESNTTMYGAVGLLVAASLWNAWLRPVTSGDRQPAVTANQKKLNEHKSI